MNQIPIENTGNAPEVPVSDLTRLLGRSATNDHALNLRLLEVRLANDKDSVHEFCELIREVFSDEAPQPKTKI